MSKRQITIKPTCMREILAFPSDRASLLWEKINQLVTDPLPDGKVKKKLHAAEGIYRLRVADHRVFYRFGDDWVSLLGVRRRQEDTYREVPGANDTADAPPDGEADLDALLEPPQATFAFDAKGPSRPLPFKLSRKWLADHQVPASAHPILRQCRTEEELLEAALPSDILSRVIEAVFPPSLSSVVEQPDLLVPSTDHLVRYKDGDLLGFLLSLDDDQRKLTRWALNGPTMVTGGAGTGKSTIALYRIKEVLERPGATTQERVLFTTYTRALIAVSQQLLEQLLTPEQLSRVRVATCDQIAREIAAAHRPLGQFESDRLVLRRLQELRKNHVPNADSAFEARLRARALARLSDQYLLEEFDWIITGRRLQSLDDYLDTPRPGRGIAFPRRLRAAVWELWQVLGQKTAGERFPHIRNEALELVRSGPWEQRWDYVFVDEAQDLSPTSLALLAEICSSPEGLFLVADSKQSIYSRSYSWASADPRLQFRGRTATLHRNYRSTQEIEQAAFAVLMPEDGETLEASSSVHSGPLPVLVRNASPASEVMWIIRFVRQMARHLQLGHSAAAVLVPTADIGRALATSLAAEGLPAVFSTGRDIDLKAETVKVLTLHSAKGLEFPIVVTGGFHEGTYPVEADFEDGDLFGERMRHERRLLYVALTRAMRGLMLLVPPNCQHPALTNLDHSHWHVETAT